MSDSNSVVLPYEKQAMHGEPMPDGLTFPDQLMYQALALLYARYRMKAITREQAIIEKKRLLDNYRVCQFQSEMGVRYVNLIKETELARSAYRKNKTIENANQLLICIDGVI